jgi:hypothetical protein
MRRKTKIVALVLLLLFAFSGVCTTLAAPAQAVLQGEAGKDSPCARGGWMWMEMECNRPSAMCSFGLVSALSSNPALISSSPNGGSESLHFSIATGHLATFPPATCLSLKSQSHLSGDLVANPEQKTSIHLFNSVLTL